MAQITWRNVAAPDFSGAAAGYEAASRMLSAGLGDASKALGGFQVAGLRADESAILADALRFQDPATLRANLQNGSIVGGRRVSPEAYKTLQNTASGLIDSDAGQLKNTQGVYGFDRLVRDNAALDNLRPVAAALAAAPTAEARQMIMSASVPQFSQAPTDAAFSLLKAAQGAEAGNQATAVGGVNTRAAVRNEGDQQQAQAAVGRILRRGGNLDPTTALAELEGMAGRGELTPGAFMAAQAAFPAAYGGGGAAGGASPTGGTAGAVSAALGASAPAALGGTGTFARAPGTAGAGTNQGSGWDITVGGISTPKPITQMTMGELEDFGKTTLIPGNKGKFGNAPNLGSSAAGAFQITNETRADFAPKVFGENWRNVPYTPATQEALGKAIFDARKDGNLKSTWTSLPDATPGAYKNMTWDQFKSVVTPGEAGGVLGSGPLEAPAVDPLTARAQTQQMNNLAANASIGQIAERSMQDNVGSVASKYVSAAQRLDADSGTVADELRAGPFKGTSRQFLLGKINEIVANGGVNPALAGEIMRQNITASDHNPLNPLPNLMRNFRGGSPNLGNGQRLNDEGIAATIAQLKQPNSPILGQALANEQRQAVQQQIQASKDNLSKAQDNVTALRLRARTQPGIAPTLERAELALQQAQSAFNAARATQMMDPGYQPNRPAPVATTVPDAEKAQYRAMGAIW